MKDRGVGPNQARKRKRIKRTGLEVGPKIAKRRTRKTQDHEVVLTRTKRKRKRKRTRHSLQMKPRSAAFLLKKWIKKRKKRKTRRRRKTRTKIAKDPPVELQRKKTR